MNDTGFPVPNSAMVTAINQVIKEFVRTPDNFKTRERRRLKELLGKDYAHIDEDVLGVRAINLRKKAGSGVISVRGVVGIRPRCGPGRADRRISEALKQHYMSEDYRRKKDAVAAKARGRCQICDAQGEEFHHRSYVNIGKPEEEADMIYVCKKCHKVCDIRRQREAGRL